jgi:hypothetical protein
MVPAAVATAAAADTVVLIVGTDLTVASEGNDAVNITFSEAQLYLINQVRNHGNYLVFFCSIFNVKKVAAAAKKPVVVVTMTAVPLDLTPLLKNPQVWRCLLGIERFMKCLLA